MDPATLDTPLRGAAFALAMATAAATLARSPRAPAARLAAFCMGGIGAFVVSSAPGALELFGPAAFLFDAWCMATPAAVCALAAVLFRDGFELRPGHWALAGAMVVVTFAGDWGRFALGPLGGYPEIANATLLAGRALALAFLAGGCWLAADSWRDDLVDARRRARLAFMAAITVVFGVLAVSEFVAGPGGASRSRIAAGLAALIAVAAGVLVALARGTLDELFTTPPPEGGRAPGLVRDGAVPAPRPVLASVRSHAVEAALAARTKETMQARQLWKREGLGIAELAKELGTQEHLLRRAINRHLGYRNFNDFLHDWRLKEAAQRLADPAQDALPVLTIALDSGYGSIGPFNRAFKARFGVTPTQYRALCRAETLAAREIGQQSG
jgi:AraC-like DNA-binding protein